MPSEPDARAGVCDAALWRRRFEEACERLESKHLSLVELEAGLNRARNAANAARVELEDVRRRLAAETSRCGEAMASLAAAEIRLDASSRRAEGLNAQLVAALAELAALNGRLSEIDPIALAHAERLTRFASRHPRITAAGEIAWRTMDALGRVLRRRGTVALARPLDGPTESLKLHVRIGPAASEHAAKRSAHEPHAPVVAGSKEP